MSEPCGHRIKLRWKFRSVLTVYGLVGIVSNTSNGQLSDTLLRRAYQDLKKVSREQGFIDLIALSNQSNS